MEVLDVLDKSDVFELRRVVFSNGRTVETELSSRLDTCVVRRRWLSVELLLASSRDVPETSLESDMSKKLKLRVT